MQIRYWRWNHIGPIGDDHLYMYIVIQVLQYAQGDTFLDGPFWRKITVILTYNFLYNAQSCKPQQAIKKNIKKSLYQQTELFVNKTEHVRNCIPQKNAINFEYILRAKSAWNILKMLQKNIQKYLYVEMTLTICTYYYVGTYLIVLLCHATSSYITEFKHSVVDDFTIFTKILIEVQYVYFTFWYDPSLKFYKVLCTHATVKKVQ